jgi:hypothetical protein
VGHAARKSSYSNEGNAARKASSAVSKRLSGGRALGSAAAGYSASACLESPRRGDGPFAVVHEAFVACLKRHALYAFALAEARQCFLQDQRPEMWRLLMRLE